jgi:hypothetical protein
MLDNPDKEWRRLTGNYAGMYDEELLTLAEDFKDLTEMAQQALRDEMKKRKLGDPLQPHTPPAPARFRSPDPEIESDAENGEEPSHEYTWKTLLCECADWSQAWQLREALQRAGIESWIDGSSRNDMGGPGPRVMVAADQLEEASAIAAQPIPQEIIDELSAETPAFEPPHCPHCGARDPILVSVEPSNTWECESCGNEWSDSAEGEAEDS